MLMNLESIIKLFHTLVLSILIHGAENSLDSKSRPPRELNTFLVWSFFSRFSFRILDTREITLLTKNEQKTNLKMEKNQQDKMSNINSKNSSDAIIESKLFKLSLVDLEKNGGIKIGSFGDRLY